MAEEFRELCEKMVRIADALDNRAPQLANQGQALDGFSALANFRHLASQARATLAAERPAPVPGWQPIDTAPQDGTEILASDYDVVEILSWSWDAWETESGWIDRNGQRLFPAWWQPLPEQPQLPQPPQGGEVEA